MGNRRGRLSRGQGARGGNTEILWGALQPSPEMRKEQRPEVGAVGKGTGKGGVTSIALWAWSWVSCD